MLYPAHPKHSRFCGPGEPGTTHTLVRAQSQDGLQGSPAPTTPHSRMAPTSRLLVRQDKRAASHNVFQGDSRGLAI